MKDSNEDQQFKADKGTSDTETAKPVEMRQSSMETLAETIKQKAEGSCDGGEPKTR